MNLKKKCTYNQSSRADCTKTKSSRGDKIPTKKKVEVEINL
jgi:hypothetical protein